MFNLLPVFYALAGAFSGMVLIALTLNLLADRQAPLANPRYRRKPLEDWRE